MDKIFILRNKIHELTFRTQKDIYRLKYSSDNKMELNDNTLSQIKLICIDAGISCPIYKENSNIKLKDGDSEIFDSLDILANKYNIILNF